MFKTEIKTVQSIGLGNLEVKNDNGVDTITVNIAKRTFNILNITDETDKKGKPYQRGDLVQGDISFGTAIVRNATIKKTGTTVPMITLTIHCLDIQQVIGCKQVWCLVENGKGSFSESKDNQQNNGTGTYDQYATEQYERSSNGY